MTTSYKLELQQELKAMKRLERAAERAAAEAAEMEAAARKMASDARIAQKLSRLAGATLAEPVVEPEPAPVEEKPTKKSAAKKAPVKKAQRKEPKNDNQGYEQG